MIEKRLFNRYGNRVLKSVMAVIWHWPAGEVVPDLDALWKWMNANSQNSYHFLVSRGRIIQTRELPFRAIHCGHKTYTERAHTFFGDRICSSLDSPNNYTVGTCILHDYPDGSYSSETLETAVELGSALFREYHLDPLLHSLRHSDLTDEKAIPCPKGFFGETGSALFDDFNLWIKEDMADIENRVEKRRLFNL